MTDNTYQGWTNYETWNVKLCLDNDEYLCNELMPKMARQYQGSVGDLARALEEFVTDPENGLVPDVQTGIGADLLTHALGMVDWHEIARAIHEDNETLTAA